MKYLSPDNMKLYSELLDQCAYNSCALYRLSLEQCISVIRYVDSVAEKPLLLSRVGYILYRLFQGG